MENKNLKLKKQILKKLKTLKNNQEIHSLHLIGSHTNKNKKLDKINDFDLLILLNNKLNPQNYTKITNQLKEISKEFETNKIYINVETTHANIKLKPKKQINIQLHQLTYYYKEFIESFNQGNLALHNWVLTAKTIFGTELKELVQINPISKNLLKHKRDSIIFFINIIQEKKNIGLKHITQNNKLIKTPINIPVTESDELELFYIAINETLGTLLKYTNQQNKIYSTQKREKFLLKTLNNKEYLKTYQILKNIKIKLRNCQKIEFNLNYFKKTTLNILQDLKQKFEI